MIDIGETLKRAVRNSGQTRYGVAKGSGIDYSVLLRFMAGEREVRLATASRLANYLGLELRPSRTKRFGGLTTKRPKSRQRAKK